MKMKRRDFSLSFGSALAAGALSWPVAQAQTTTPATAADTIPEAGADYLALPKPAPVDTAAGKIEVVEFFSYDCPHCNAFEPAFGAWIKRAPKDVVVKRAPVPFIGAFERRQRLYF
jgi:protein dithiol oxidoreductase (disulfide-forming)